MKALRTFMNSCTIFIVASVAFLQSVSAQQSFPQQSSAPQSQVVVTKQLLAFQQIEGQSQWQSSIKTRLMGAKWQFNSDGTFYYNVPDGSSALFPIKGKFLKKDATLVFAGNAAAKVGAGVNTVTLYGKLYRQGDQTLISMHYESGSSMSAQALTLHLAQTRSNAYDFTVSLR